VIGPSHQDTALAGEELPDPPSRWYLTGFLVPVDAPVRQKSRDPQEEMDTPEEGGADDTETPDRGPSRSRYLPSSIGLSLLVEPGADTLRVTGAGAITGWKRSGRRADGAIGNGGERSAKSSAMCRWRRARRPRLAIPKGSKSPAMSARHSCAKKAASATCSRCRCFW
jgi:hypothetical protein